MTDQERTNLISGFLADNAGKTDENTASLLNMLVESLRSLNCNPYSPALQRRKPLPLKPESKVKNKSFLKFTKKDLNQMADKYRNIFAHGDKIVSYRQKKNGVYEARYHRNGIDVEVSSKDLAALKQKFCRCAQ